MPGLKRKILIALAVIAAIAVGLTVREKRADRRATYQGIHVRDWAIAFYPDVDPHGTNIARTAFQVMGQNAVPALRKMLRSRPSLYEKLFVQHGNKLPRGVRAYLSEKINPGRASMYRFAAVRVLGVMGTNATAAVPDLAAALSYNDIRFVAAQALTRMGETGIAPLASATTNNNVSVRHAAVYGQGQSGSNAWLATEVLLERVRDPAAEVRGSALYSLGRIGRPGMMLVLETLSTNDPVRRATSLEAIRSMTNPPNQVFMTLLEFSTNVSPSLRANSLEALQSLRLNHPRVLITYFKAIDDPDPGVRASAVRALGQASIWATNSTLGGIAMRQLGRSGSLDSNIVVTLNGLLTDPDYSVRTNAQQTLAKLESPTPN